MNLTEMLALLRCDLRDEETPRRWSDAALTRHLGRALGEFSLYLPLEESMLLVTVSGAYTVDISSVAGLINVWAVEQPMDGNPACYRRFSVRAGTLSLSDGRGWEGEEARMYYGRGHSIGADGGTVPEHLCDLVLIGAAGHAAAEWALFAVNRATAGEGVTRQYAALGAARLAFFRAELKRLAGQRRVRVGQLYGTATVR